MIPNQTLSQFPEFANTGTKTAPGDAKYSQGFQPSDVLPAEWLNYFLNGSTKGVTDLNAGVKSIEAEINNVLSAKNITPQENTNNQLLQAIRDLTVPIGMIYQQYPLEKAPWELWTFTQEENWEDISSHYAGLFPRIAGNNAEAFEKQLDCSVNSTIVTFSDYTSNAHGVTTASLLIDPNTWEQREVTAVDGANVTINAVFSNPTNITKVLVVQDYQLKNHEHQIYGTTGTSGSIKTGVQVITNVAWNWGLLTIGAQGANVGSENRPRNFSVCIWKRVS